MINHRLKSILFPLVFGLNLILISCIESNKSDQVEVSLSKVPAGVDWLSITLVNFEDTSIVYETLWDAGTLPAKPFIAPLGLAQGHNWLVKVRGYQDSILVYHVLIPSDPSNIPQQLEVRSGWPSIFFTSTTHDTTGIPDTITFTTHFRNVPPGSHWHLNYSPIDYDISLKSFLNVPVPRLKIRKLNYLIADLHVNGTHALLPVQEPDTILVDEVLSPAGSKVGITQAYQDAANNVHLILALENFKLPTVDTDLPGEGEPLVHNRRGMVLLPGFHHLDGDPTHIMGPASDLTGVDTLVVALHYTSGLRIRPPVQASLAVSTALRLQSTIPSIRIVSSGVSATDTTLYSLTLERTNYTGMHTHIYRNVFGDPLYNVCDGDQCMVQEKVWKGAKALVVAVHLNGSHNPVMPLILDTLSLP